MKKIKTFMYFEGSFDHINTFDKNINEFLKIIDNNINSINFNCSKGIYYCTIVYEEVK